MAYKYIKAKSVSYGSKRDKSAIKYIVIHYTGNNGDTAVNNANYFKNSNTREAGAHFFVDQNGTVIKSIAMNLTAWSVGGVYKTTGGAGTYYKKCTNANSVSIEMCDTANKDASDKMITALKKLIKHIQKYCPNAKTIIRHYDVNGKTCPARYIDSAKWESLKAAISPSTSKGSVILPNETLKVGSKGTAVKNLQDALNKIASQGLTVDGSYGKGTAQAVKNIQIFCNLKQDGVYGNNTRTALAFLATAQSYTVRE